MRVKGLQIAGALVAAGTLLATWVLPRPAAELATPPEAAEVTAPDLGPSSHTQVPDRAEAAKQRARHASADRVEKLLAKKMPAVSAKERLRLAGAILEEARFAALDPLFVLALIAVESGFDHGAESVRGARGLMQLRDATLADEAERSNIDGDLDDPVTNVRAGVRYYRRLLRAFGSHELALMAYNAGPNRILRYMKEEGEIPERFHSYPRKVHAELWKLQKGGVPAGRGPAKELGPLMGPVPPPAASPIPPLAPVEPLVEAVPAAPKAP